MLLLILLLPITFAIFFYCQALSYGLSRKRWACAGLFFGPLMWPMFMMKARMHIHRLYGVNWVIVKV